MTFLTGGSKVSDGLLGSIAVQVSAKTTNFRKGMKSAGKDLKRFSGDV